jgi:hypothetical protein
MKEETLRRLHEMKRRLQALRREIRGHPRKQVSATAIRGEAGALADYWVEHLRGPLEEPYHIDPSVVQDYAREFTRLHRLSRPNNLASSYLTTLDALLKGFDDRLVLPVQQYSERLDSVLDLANILGQIPDAQDAEYLEEGIDCARHGNLRASIVLGWCAAVDRLQRRIIREGFGKFNAASARLKSSGGRYKWFSHQFSISSAAELAEVADHHLLVVLEGMDLLQGNERDRLGRCLDLRNESAHPGRAPVGEPHVVAFYSDIAEIVLRNPRFVA